MEFKAEQGRISSGLSCTLLLLLYEGHLQRVLMKDLWMLGSLRSGASPPGTGSSGPGSPWRHLEVKPGAAYKFSKKS